MKIEKDRKGDTYVITTEDNEGFHKSINLTWDEMVEVGDYVHREWLVKGGLLNEIQSGQDC